MHLRGLLAALAVLLAFSHAGSAEDRKPVPPKPAVKQQGKQIEGGKELEPTDSMTPFRTQDLMSTRAMSPRKVPVPRSVPNVRR
jgi:hypothetical protein